MSLTTSQTEATRREFKVNISRSGRSLAQIADALHTTPDIIAQCVDLHPNRIEDPWIIRNYLLNDLAQQGLTAEPFTALVGDYHQYWFLDAARIERGIID